MTHSAILWSRRNPAETIVLAMLTLVTAVLLLRWTATGPALTSHIMIHGGLLAAYCMFLTVFARRTGPTVRLTRDVVAVNGLLVLYLTLAKAPFLAIPVNGDAIVAGLDRLIGFGSDPVVAFSHVLHPPWTDILALLYSVFVPYLYFSIFLGLFGRPAWQRRRMVLGLVVTYSLGFLGYLFIPAYGPIVYFADSFAGPVPGGVLVDLVTGGVNAVGGPHGAFPSLHIGAATFICLFDLKIDRLRGLIYLPMVVSLVLATVGLRYHYVIDLAVGFAIAVFAYRIAFPPRPAMLGPFERFIRFYRRLVARTVFCRDMEATGLERIPAAGPVLLVARARLHPADVWIATASSPRFPLVLLPAWGWALRFLGQLRHLGGLILTDMEGRDETGPALMVKRLAIGGVGLVFIDPSRGKSDPALRVLAKAREAGLSNLTILPLAIHHAKKRETVWLHIGEAVSMSDETMGSGALDQIGTELGTRGGRLAMLQLTEIWAEMTRDDPDFSHQRRSWRGALRLFPEVLTRAPQPAKLAAREMSRLALRSLAYGTRLERLGLRPEEVFLPVNPGRTAFYLIREFEVMLVGWASCIIGVLTHLLPILLMRALYPKMGRAMGAIVGLIVFPLGYLAQMALLAPFLPWWGLLLYFAAGLLGAATLIEYMDRAGGVRRRILTFVTFLSRPDFQRRLAFEAERMSSQMRIKLAGLR